jgi:hypothetical protein
VHNSTFEIGCGDKDLNTSIGFHGVILASQSVHRQRNGQLRFYTPVILTNKLLTGNLNNMATAGYSGTPLLKKLGIKDEMKVLAIHPPANYFDLLDKNISAQFCKKNEIPHLVHLFADTKKIFEKEMQSLQSTWQKNTSIVIWVSWYKKATGIATDITEDFIRNYALANGLVDIKVCAVSDLWSGLKLVVPVAKRNTKY